MKINLTRIAIILAVCLTCVSAAMATPACGQTSATSPAQTAALNPLYVASNGDTYTPAPGYTCDIGNLQFSNFTYSASLADEPGPAFVNAQPVTTPGDQGFNFTGPFSTSSGAAQYGDVNIGFTVTALTGSIDDIGIDIAAANTTGTGNINYTEQFCTTTTASGSQVCSIYTDTPTGPLSTEINLSNTALGGPVTTLTIMKDVSLNAGSNGTAYISAFGNVYSNSTVPEPRAVSILLSLGLFAIIVFMKKRQAARS